MSVSLPPSAGRLFSPMNHCTSQLSALPHSAWLSQSALKSGSSVSHTGLTVPSLGWTCWGLPTSGQSHRNCMPCLSLITYRTFCPPYCLPTTPGYVRFLIPQGGHPEVGPVFLYLPLSWWILLQASLGTQGTWRGGKKSRDHVSADFGLSRNILWNRVVCRRYIEGWCLELHPQLHRKTWTTMSHNQDLGWCHKELCSWVGPSALCQTEGRELGFSIPRQSVGTASSWEQTCSYHQGKGLWATRSQGLRNWERVCPAKRGELDRVPQYPPQPSIWVWNLLLSWR